MQKINKKGEFSFYEALEKLIFDLPERSREILKNRYGIVDKGAKTLEEIGNNHQVTRERIRQIIKEVFKKIQNRHQDNIFVEVKRKIEFTIRQNNGIIKKENILSKLGGDAFREHGSIKIFLESHPDIVFNEKREGMEDSISFKDFDFDEWERIREKSIAVLDKGKKTLGTSELLERILEEEKNISEEKLLSYLSVSKEIKKNKFNKWGKGNWIEINPKIVWQKTYLVLKESGKPMHYKEIAKLIDKYYPSRKRAHPQTVHNELIKNERFVLVGRGIYALAEWGYKKGTVREVLEDILNANSKPMKVSEILDSVLKVRKVKKSTVFINLNNFFEKVGKDAYTVKK